MKTYGKIVSSIISLMVAVLVLASASFAWFSLSNTLSATGMSASIVAPNNLWITKIADGEGERNWGEKTDFTGFLVGSELIPASSFDGYNVTCIDYSAAVSYDNGVITDGTSLITAPTEGVECGYVDFVVYLRTDNISDVEIYTQEITVEAEEGTASDSLKPYRVALLYTDTTKTPSTCSYVYNVNNGVSDKVIDCLSFPETYGEDLLKTPVYVENTIEAYRAATIPVSNSGETTITIRVWYEGQDSECKSSAVNSSFNMEILFDTVS